MNLFNRFGGSGQVPRLPAVYEDEIDEEVSRATIADFDKIPNDAASWQLSWWHRWRVRWIRGRRVLDFEREKRQRTQGAASRRRSANYAFRLVLACLTIADLGLALAIVLRAIGAYQTRVHGAPLWFLIPAFTVSLGITWGAGSAFWGQRPLRTDRADPAPNEAPAGRHCRPEY